jgi:hypothetical protein
MKKGGAGSWEVHSTPFGTVYKYRGTHPPGKLSPTAQATTFSADELMS